MKRFELEDFFDKYEHVHEHVPGLINLASSDALPWNTTDIARDVLDAAVADLTLKYPNVNRSLLPGLEGLCRLPPEAAVLPTSGAAEAIALVMHELASLGKGGLVAIPVPGYGAFLGLSSLLGLEAKTYEYHPGRNWAPDLDELLELSRRCPALIINNPHNPSGHVLPDEFLRTIAQEMGARGATLIVDEVFRTDGETCSAVELGSDVVTIGSLSKVYGLPGLRLGWIIANKELVGRLRTLQQYFTLTLNSFTVSLGSAVLKDLKRFSRTDLIRKNRKILIGWAEAYKETLSISSPLGGTTVCLTVNSPTPADVLFERFLEAKVLLAPGERCFEFGEDLNWYRLGYGTSPDDLHLGLSRVSEVLGR